MIKSPEVIESSLTIMRFFIQKFRAEYAHKIRMNLHIFRVKTSPGTKRADVASAPLINMNTALMTSPAMNMAPRTNTDISTPIHIPSLASQSRSTSGQGLVGSSLWYRMVGTAYHREKLWTSGYKSFQDVEKGT